MRLIFQILIGLSALFIAGCSAYFSVKGLGLLFAGSAMAVMVMAASLEVGKLVAASFLYQYWSRIGIMVRAYLMLAVAVLVCITSLGIYGYLARAYERTNSDIALLQQQIDLTQQEINTTQARIDGSRNQIGKLSDADRQDMDKLRQQITQAGVSLDTALTRLQERRKSAADKRDKAIDTLHKQAEAAAKTLDASLARLQDRRKAISDKRDRDTEQLNARGAEATKLLNAALASEDAEIASLNERIAVLDRAVDAYTREGGAGFLKVDSIRLGQQLRKQQQPQRDAIAADITKHNEIQEQKRTAHAAAMKEIDQQIAVVRDQFPRDAAALDEEEKALRKALADAGPATELKVTAASDQFTREVSALDDEEKSLRKANSETISASEKQLAALQAKDQNNVADGSNQIEAMYQRIRSGNEEIRHLREQITTTDVGSYRFVARAFNASVDDVVKWLILIIVVVFDPLAVALTIGFNVALNSGKKPRNNASNDRASNEGDSNNPSNAGSAPAVVSIESSTPNNSENDRGTQRGPIVIATVSIALATCIIGGGAYVLFALYQDHLQTSHANLVPSDSFAVVAIRPQMIRQSASTKTATAPATNANGLLSQPVAAELSDLLSSGFDPSADVYGFLKYPTERNANPGNHPVILCGLIMRVTNPAAAEAGLSRFAQAITSKLRLNTLDAPALSRSRVMVQSGKGKYLAPEGGFFTFGLTDNEAILLLEIEGDPAHPRIEQEMQLCLAAEDPNHSSVNSARTETATRRHVLPSGGAMALWFDAARCFSQMPKSPAAQTRYQQLQRHLDFDLSLFVEPAGDGQLHVIGQYTYNSERFAKNGTPTLPVLELLAKLGPAETAGVSGRLMDRCADTLDCDSLIEHLRVALSNPPSNGVVVERTAASPRDARFVLTARYDPQAGSPLLAALKSLSLF